MTNTRKDVENRRLQQIKDAIEAVMRDLATPQTQENEMKLNTRLEQLLQESDKLEKSSLVLSQTKKEGHWDKNLYKINYKKSKSQIKEVLDGFQGGTGAALFLIKGYDTYCGDYCK